MREFASPRTYSIEATETVADLVFTKAAQRPDFEAFWRPDGAGWAPVTAAAFAEQVVAVAKGMIASGVEPGDRIALMSAIRYEWPLLDYAIWCAGGISVPIYETSAAAQIDWILEDSGATLLIIEGDKQQAEVDQLGGKLHDVREVFRIVGGEPAIDRLIAAGVGLDDELVRSRVEGTGADDLATVIYTSGTTGRPKGCELTHRNLLAEARAVASSPAGVLLKPGERSLFFLPMAHILSRGASIAMFESDVTVGHFADTKNIVPQFAIFQPSIIISVPRVFEKVYAGARKNAADGGKAKIFDAATEVAISYSKALDAGGPGLVLKLKHAVFDKLVYGKLRAAMGGRCVASISGGAPLGDRLGHFFRGVGVTLYEGYGLTETTASITVNTPGFHKIGTVGRPLPGHAIRIAEDGEVLCAGDVVLRGYWQNPKATAESIQDGWFHTGDLGVIDDEGFLSIVGRKKEILVTAGGKNVAPAQIEDALRANPLVSQAMLTGDQRPFIGVLITIDPEALQSWKSEHGKPESATVADLVDDPDLKAAIDEAVAAANSAISHAEQIKKVAILPVDFTEETGEMTPTMKVKRNVVAEKFSDVIEGLYGK